MSLSLPQVTTVVTDIEGTCTPIAFVKDTLFPYARGRIPAFIAAHAGDADVAGICAAAAALGGVEASDLGGISAVLLRWMDTDAKVQPLKDIQGLIWRDGYARGELRGEVFPDAAECLRAWSARGIQLAVYSSGSVPAQKLLFGHSVAGDLLPYFRGFYDTTIGGKRESASYERILREIGVPPNEAIFFSDNEVELDAALDAGVQTVQLARAEDGTTPTTRHASVESFYEIELER